MANVTARIKVKGKHFEIEVFLDEALKVREGKSSDLDSALDCNAVYADMKKGKLASNSELVEAFGTTDFHEIAKHIITKGEVQKTQEFRDSEREAKVKRVIDLILRNAVDQHGRPYTAERITRAMTEAHAIVDNRAPEQQVNEILGKLKTVIPITVETKRIKITVPARFTGQTFGMFKEYKESEDWLANGDLQVIINIPSGMQIDFYEKLNNVTHGAVQSEEIKPKV